MMDKLNSFLRSALPIDKINAFTSHKYFKSTHWTQGVPLILFILGGSIWLREFTKLRYEHKISRPLTEQEVEMQRGMIQQNMEEMYKNTVEKMDLNDWQNIRGPRPGENSREMQRIQREKIAAMKNQQTLSESLKEKKA